MLVHVVSPNGYCKGVQRAMEIAYSAAKEHPDRPVFLLGMLVHNEDAIASLEQAGLTVLDEAKAPLDQQLSSIPKGAVVVYSAHGHPKRYENIAKQRDLIVYDATCPFVNDNLRSFFQAEKPVIYLGVRGHLEAEAFRENADGAYFFDVKTMKADALPSDKEAEAIAQTTLSDSEIEKALESLKASIPSLRLRKGTCYSTTLRQKAMRSLPKDVDVVLVLGSPRSNNSAKLKEIAESQGYETHFVLNVEELKRIDLSGKRKAALASGASTSPEAMEAALAYLESL